jgi:hypothetical protein
MKCGACGQDCVLSMITTTQVLNDKRLAIISDLFNRENELIAAHRRELQNHYDDFKHYLNLQREELETSAFQNQAIRTELQNSVSNLEVTTIALDKLSIKFNDVTRLLHVANSEVEKTHAQLWDLIVKTSQDERDKRVSHV